MDKELNLLVNILQNPLEDHSFSSIIWKGSVNSHDVFLSRCGIGKVNSALNAYRLIQEIAPDLVINSGVAGGTGTPIGTILLADRIAYNDVWCGPGTEYGQADGFPLYFEPSKKILSLAGDPEIKKGLICSGDKFISTVEEIDFIRSKFPDVKAVDMESASIAQTCMLCNLPFAIIRIVSDTPGEGENISQYKDFWATAPEKTFSVLSAILHKI